MDLRPLIQILANGAFHSGGSLAQQLNVTRTVVGRQIEALRNMGIEIHSVTGKGYRLPSVLELMSAAQILEQLGDDRRLWSGHIEMLFSTGSTNVDAMRKAQEGKTHYLVLAEHQAQGRGRRGKPWVSPLGANIAMSMLWTFKSKMAALEGLSLAVAILVVDALNECGYEGIGVKWPNDILLSSSKLAGILIEISGDAEGPCKVVIGVGINIKMPYSSSTEIDQAYADLASNFEGTPNRSRIVAALVRSLTAGLGVFAKSGFRAFQPRWNDIDIYKERDVEISSGSTRRVGRALGVSEAGALLLETESGVAHIAGGELTPSLRPLKAEQGGTV